MKPRNAIIFLLSLTLACSGCATGAYKARSGATPVVQNQIGQHRVSENTHSSISTNQSATFGLLGRSAVAESGDAPSQPDRSLADIQTAPKKTILSVGYLEDDQDRSSSESKIDSSTVEEAESTSDELDQICCSSDNVSADDESGGDSDSELSPPSPPVSYTHLTLPTTPYV